LDDLCDSEGVAWKTWNNLIMLPDSVESIAPELNWMKFNGLWGKPGANNLVGTVDGPVSPLFKKVWRTKDTPITASNTIPKDESGKITIILFITVPNNYKKEASHFVDFKCFSSCSNRSFEFWVEFAK
jgi:hypothetical protein